LRLIGKNPAYIDELNFTTPSNIRKKAENIFGLDNVYTLPGGARYAGFLNKYIYALGLLNFYLKLKLAGQNSLADHIKERFVYIKKIVKFENETIIKLISYIVSMLLLIFEPFITDFRLIVVRRC
jgi:hypothetical protein